MKDSPFLLQAVCAECGKTAHTEESAGLISVVCFTDGCSQKMREFRYNPPVLVATLEPMNTWKDLGPAAMTKPGGNKTLPRCEVPDCVNQASFIINERALCSAHRGESDSYALPPSLREKA